MLLMSMLMLMLMFSKHKLLSSLGGLASVQSSREECKESTRQGSLQDCRVRRTLVTRLTLNKNIRHI